METDVCDSFVFVATKFSWIDFHLPEHVRQIVGHNVVVSILQQIQVKLGNELNL